MQPDDLILVSIDDHVVEPPDMFDNHVPARWRDQAPKLATADDGREFWDFQGVRYGTLGTNTVVGWPKEEWGMDPVRLAEMRPGAYDIDERIRDMDRNGVLGSMCFPTFTGFSGGFFNSAPDKDAAEVMVRAYNDWHIDEWCAAHPGRMIPLTILPTWSVDAMVAEIRRVAGKGARAVTLPEVPYVQDLPPYHDIGHWGPVFEALSDEHLVMCLHIGQGFSAIRMSPGASLDNLMILATQVSVLAAQDLLWGRAMRDYPDLRIAWSEAGIGWIPFYLDRCDRHYENQVWLGQDFGGKLPSEVFKERSLACYITDPTALKVRHDIGIDIIAWECDFPHSDSIWPDAPEAVAHEMAEAGVPDAEVHKITWENACRFFEWDPFTAVPRTEATVGHLRARATDVDTTTRSRAEWRDRFEAAAS